MNTSGKKLLTTMVAMALIIVSTVYAQSNETGYKVGDVVSDFTLKNVDGANTLLSETVDKGVIVIFTCNTCPYSVAYEDRIIALDATFKTKGYPVVAINPNDIKRKPGDSYDAMIERSKDKGFTFPYLYDETQNIAKTFGATKTPHVYVLKSENNQLKVKFIGAIDNSPWDASTVEAAYVADAVNALVEDKEIETPEAKAIGCTIKWKES